MAHSKILCRLAELTSTDKDIKYSVRNHPFRLDLSKADNSVVIVPRDLTPGYKILYKSGNGTSPRLVRDRVALWSRMANFFKDFLDPEDILA